jgi:sulfite reductase (NADPH) flavoprotein alpha-component
MANWSAKNPYMSKITECYVLNGEGSRKETRHIVFDLGDSELDYKVGDALGVLSENPENTVDLLIETAGWDENQMVSTRNGERTLKDALKKDFEIHRVNKKFVNSLSGKVTGDGMRITVELIERYRESVAGNGTNWMGGDSPLESKLLSSIPGDDPIGRVESLTTDGKAMEDYIWSRDYIDVMIDFDVKYSVEEFLELADKLKPRLYSIASSHDAHPGFVELTVGIVRYSHHGRERGGLCTVYLADEVETNNTGVGVFMSSGRYLDRYHHGRAGYWYCTIPCFHGTACS